MKAVMYHYVRPDSGGLPHLRYLPLDSFRRQLDHFEQTCGIAAEAELAEALTTGAPGSDAVVLTFDDGFADHHRFVLPELRARGLWGIFYVPTLPHVAHRMLDVHKVHVLLGRHGGSRALSVLLPLIDDEMLEPSFVTELRGALYRGHVEDAATAEVKRLLNYYVKVERRAALCDELFRRLGGDESAEVARHYASAEQLCELRGAGMTVGSHSVSHRLLSQLTPDEQAREVHDSLATLRGILGEDVTTFCFPYGGDHSFDEHTLSLLRVEGVRYCFSVEPRDITADDIAQRRLALPRHDCNAFPHGCAAGATPQEVHRPGE